MFSFLNNAEFKNTEIEEQNRSITNALTRDFEIMFAGIPETQIDNVLNCINNLSKLKLNGDQEIELYTKKLNLQFNKGSLSNIELI